MARFPYTNFPFPFYRNCYKMPAPEFINNNAHYQKNRIIDNSYPSSNPQNFLEFNNLSEDNRISNQKNKSNKNNDDYLFDLFGLKIYYDDVLLVSLIYFLYSEGVKDDGLFIVLILLLIS